jgi:predicted phage terminase large subunit-like protein
MQEATINQLKEIRRTEFGRKTIRCVADFYEFFDTFWFTLSGDELITNWHIVYLCNELQELGERIVNKESSLYDLIINVPPGMSKSTIVSQSFPVWLWLKDPSINVITSSYSGDLSIDHSLRSKAIVKSDLFTQLFQPYFLKVFGRYLRLIKDNEKDWRNNFTGARYATSTGGTVTGKHAHLIIRDDPINPEQAESKLYRDRCNRFNDRSLSSRKKDKENTPTVTVMQRLHEEDTTGHDLSKAGKRIKHICLPAELTKDVKPEVLRKFYKDGLLDPVRLNTNVLADARIDLGSYGYAGQMLQTPLVSGGNVFRSEWFKKFSVYELEDKVSFEGKNIVWNFCIDGAYTEESKNDATAIIAYAYMYGNVYVRECLSVRKTMPDVLKFIPEFVKRNGYNTDSRIDTEPKATGLSVIQSIRAATNLNIMAGEQPKGDIKVRAASVVPFVESGRVYLLRDGAWNQDFLEEAEVFPFGKHDDRLDTLIMAIRKSRELDSDTFFGSGTLGGED